MNNYYKPTKEDERLVIETACELASAIHKLIHDKPKVHKFGMTVTGVAVEMILSHSPHWDDSSREFRKFLGYVHEDLKKMEIDKIILS